MEKFNLFLTDAYGPGHQSVEHTALGTAIDVVPGPGGSWDQVGAAVASAVNSGYTPVYYDGSGGSINLPPHGPGHHAHITMLTAAEYGSGAPVGASVGGGGGGGPAPRINLKAPKVGGSGMAGVFGQLASELMTGGAEKAVNKKLGAAGGGGGPVNLAGGLMSWLSQALRITGHFSPANLEALKGRAMQESGGDPRSINLWDSNAAAGIPSKGLLQTIDPTFDAHKMPGMNNIWNPVHNAVAAIRYMFDRYGHIVGPSGTGYATGGRVPDFGGWFGEGGSFMADRPTMIGVGEKGSEHVQITPTRGGKGTSGSVGATNVTIQAINIENHRKGDVKKAVKQEIEAAFTELSRELQNNTGSGIV